MLAGSATLPGKTYIIHALLSFESTPDSMGGTWFLDITLA